ncbi:uncharacterized protein [Branchiostoma lanceolatum]|uniref:uncharacterized protein n=1 Tax=Branchiostoma lanceolatum TaxID=7740 RepID=UPI00345557E8
MGVAVYCCHSNKNRLPSTPRVGAESTPREHIPMQFTGQRPAAINALAYPPPYPADNAQQPRLRQTYFGAPPHTSSFPPYTSEFSAQTSPSLPYTDLPYTMHPPPEYSADPSSQPPPYMTSQEPHARMVQPQPYTGHQGLPYPD